MLFFHNILFIASSTNGISTDMPFLFADKKGVVMEQTIAAISTALSPAAVGMIRISGPAAFQVADRVFSAQSGKRLESLSGYCALYGSVRDEGGVFDHAVTTVFRAPKSYTGENVAEITVHGGPYLVRRLLRAVLANGARLALPGEFTRRAFENGKMDLTQAEAVGALISAEGQQQALSALEVCDGRLSKTIDGLYDRLIVLLGKIAAYCDYPDEDIVDVSRETLQDEIDGVRAALDEMLTGFDCGSVIAHGVDTVIVGSPNVGKSTLMNLLAGYEKSIVTDIAGTTRDIVEDTVSVGDFQLRLSDTAGLRDTDDRVEAVGVDRARSRLRQAALVLAVFDLSRPLSTEDHALLGSLKGRNALGILNKEDLPVAADTALLEQSFERTVRISAAKGTGSQDLRQAIAACLEQYHLSGNARLLVNERQYDCARRAAGELEQAAQAVCHGQTPDLVGILLEQAAQCLAELRGTRVTDAVVNEIFSKFCVGK